MEESRNCVREDVAEKNLVFLFGALIWPLGSTHIFTQSGLLILFIPDHFFGQHQIGESPPNTFSSSEDKKDRRLTVRSSIAAAAASTQWEKPSDLWTPCVYSLRSRVPSWISIRWIQFASHRNNSKSPSTMAMSTVMQNSVQTPSHFIRGQHIWRHSRFSPQTTRTTHSWTTTSPSLTSKHDIR